MKYRPIYILFFFLAAGIHCEAQKPFSEGTVTYKVKIGSPDNKEVAGVYSFIIKGTQLKKELKLNNGYQDVVLIDCKTNSVHSLQNLNGKKYAIELNMADMTKRQEQYTGFSVNNEQSLHKNLAGYAAYSGNVTYRNGSVLNLTLIKEWFPALAITFERFPAAKFFPACFSYTDENQMTMTFEAEKIIAGPIENSVFRIPPDYKMISNAEYKQLSK